MFSFVRERIFVQLFWATAVGCACGSYWPLPVDVLVGDILLLLLLIAALGALWRLWREDDKPWGSIPGYILLAVVGFLAASTAIGFTMAATLVDHAGAPLEMHGTVSSIPAYQRGHLRFMLRVDEVEVGHENIAVSGQCYVYLRCEEPPELYYTESVELYATLRDVPPPSNNGQFDYRRYLMMRGTTLTAYATSPAALRHTGQTPPWLWKSLTQLRTWLVSSLNRGLPEELGALAVSVVYGDKIIDLPGGLDERFRRAGLTHILVASGTQVSLLIIVLGLILWRATDDFTWRGLLRNLAQFTATMLIVLVYAAVTGFEVSILRAVAMGALVLLGKLLHRQADGLNALAQSGLILLVTNPLQLTAPGFQLSFGATFGLIYVAGVGFPFLARLRGWRSYFLRMLLSTGGAQLFVTPILAAQFQQLSLWGLLSNLLAIPLAFALLIIGGVASVGLVAVPLLGDGLRLIIHLLAWLLDGVARLFASLPGSDVAVPHPALWYILAAYALIFLAGEWIKSRGVLSKPARRWIATASVSLAALLTAGLMHWLLVPAPELVALQLPRCEAYLWRPYTGRNILLLRSKGLESSHNADTVAAALRYRGINRLHGLVWLDKPPDEPISGLDAPTLAPGDAVPAEWDLGWLPAAGEGVAGARMALGVTEVWVAWDNRLAAGTVASTADGQPGVGVLVLTQSTLSAMSMGRQADVAAACRVLCVLSAEDEGAGHANLVRSIGEVRVKPARDGVTVHRWAGESQGMHR